MIKELCVFIIPALAVSSAAAAQEGSARADRNALAKALSGVREGGSADCKSDDPDTVVVCGRSQQHFRIDPSVLAATRAADAPPPKPSLDATSGQPCTGSQCGGGNYIPLIGMAEVAIKAAELAVQGDDWREAFRTRPDQYQLYRAEQKKKGGVSVGVRVGNH